MGKTLFDKVWDAHVVYRTENGSDVLYIDRHYIHEVTSPQAFHNLENRDIGLWRTDKTFATADHNVPTQNQHLPISEPLSRKQVEMLTFNCEKYHIPYYHLTHPNQGIVHVIGPELGLTRPGMTIVCGDSHTSTHGAFGCIAFGIGTSQVEQVFATHCLILKRPKTMRITVDGKLSKGVGAKDLILYIISKLGIGGATGYFVEYSGEAIRDLSMEGRMTVCNMSIEMGARGGLIAPDQKTYDYLSTTAYRPGKKEWDDAIRFWKSLQSEYTAEFDFEQRFDATDIEPMVTYGTNPGMGLKIRDSIPSANGDQSKSKSLAYMDLETGQQLLGKKIQHVFIGSCTNSRIEDLREAAQFIKGKHKAEHVSAMVVPGSKLVEKQANEEGLCDIFRAAGFDFREPGCSACLGMNEDKIPEGEYCVSTSNRNFEGRQGPGSRTILASPLTAAAAAIAGKIIDVRDEL